MTLSRDPYPSGLAATLEAARRMTAPLDTLSRHQDWLKAAGRIDLGRSATALDLGALGRHPVSDRIRAFDALDRVNRDLFPEHRLDQASRISEIARAVALPDL